MSSPQPPFRPGPPAGAHWRGWPEIREDLRTSLRLVLVLALVGVPAGLAWWGLAPRADFRITDAGPQALSAPSDELLVADDLVFVAVVAVVGVLAGIAVWSLRRRRGVAILVALALGALATAVVAWQLGELLGPAPTEEQVTEVGAVVTTSLTLGSPAALALAPFTAVLAYVMAALSVHDDGLGRTPAARRTDEPAAWAADHPAGGPERPLVDVPRPGWPQS